MVFHWWLLSPLTWDVARNDVPPEQGTLLHLFLKTPLNVLMAGNPGVMAFFVISGTVLALTLREVDKEAYRPFVIKRFCRIYLPYMAAVLMSLVAMVLIRPEPIAGLSFWFNAYSWSHDFGPVWFLNYVLMTNHDTTLDPVIWSLGHEMRVSIIFPLLYLILKRGGLWALASITALSMAAEAAQATLAMHWTVREVLSTVKYLYLFAFGTMLYLHPFGTHDTSPRARVISGLLWLPTLALASWSVRLDPLGDKAQAFVTAGAAGIMIVALCLRSNWMSDRVFGSRVARWFGKMSYSLYLIHIPVLLVLVHLFSGTVDIVVIGLAGILGAILLAWGMSATVERWSQLLGRRLAAPYRHRETALLGSDGRAPASVSAPPLGAGALLSKSSG
jgi:peptidoglycan/LPS O-acetylase OafA/YrhL